MIFDRKEVISDHMDRITTSTAAYLKLTTTSFLATLVHFRFMTPNSSMQLPYSLIDLLGIALILNIISYIAAQFFAANVIDEIYGDSKNLSTLLDSVSKPSLLIGAVWLFSLLFSGLCFIITIGKIMYST